MSFRTDLLAAVEAARSVAGPEGLDVRTNQLTIRTRTWSGSALGDGTTTDVDLVLPAHYVIRQITTDEISSSGGDYEVGDLLVNHITPSDGAGTGYTPQQLKPHNMANNVEVLYLIAGDHSGEYCLKELRTSRAFSYAVVLRRRRTTP
jgi:hypothetical protein